MLNEKKPDTKECRVYVSINAKFQKQAKPI
jgi:hypothetical protein